MGIESRHGGEVNRPEGLPENHEEAGRKPSDIGASSGPDLSDLPGLDGPEQYIDFVELLFDVRLSGAQKQILRSVAENQRTIVVSGNGPGKSFAESLVVLGYMLSNEDATGLGTSGSYSQFVDGVWRTVKEYFNQAKEDESKPRIPGKATDSQQPRLEIDDNWYFRVVAPRDPGDLEGRHSGNQLVVIEEADKKYITDEHFDSAGSTITGGNDRMLAVANPPKDPTDVVARLMESDRWNLIQFSSFDSYNVQVDLGNESGPKIVTDEL